MPHRPCKATLEQRVYTLCRAYLPAQVHACGCHIDLQLCPNAPALQVVRETGARFGGVLYVDSLSAAEGPVPSYLDLLRVTIETIAAGLSGAGTAQ